MVGSKAKDAVKDSGVGEAEKEEKLTKELKKEMEFHVNNLAETIEKDTKELEKEEGEQKKHITMDDLHDGFESKVSGMYGPIVAIFILTFSSYTVCTAGTRTGSCPQYQIGEERERKSDDDRSLEPQIRGGFNKQRSFIQTSRRGRGRGRRTGANSVTGGIFQNPSGRLPEVLRVYPTTSRRLRSWGFRCTSRRRIHCRGRREIEIRETVCPSKSPHPILRKAWSGWCWCILQEVIISIHLFDP